MDAVDQAHINRCLEALDVYFHSHRMILCNLYKNFRLQHGKVF